MMTLIIGGSGSGKSACAEDYAAALSGKRLSAEKYYLATMRADGRESEEKIRRHRRLRRGRGFITIEQPTDIRVAAEKMRDGSKIALLECVANLAANEMFAGGMPKEGSAVAEKIVSGIMELREKLSDLVIVSNNIFEDGEIYDETTMAYIRAMGRINERLAAAADEVIEVIAGIPVVIKERQKGSGEPCIF